MNWLKRLLDIANPGLDESDNNMLDDGSSFTIDEEDIAGDERMLSGGKLPDIDSESLAEVVGAQPTKRLRMPVVEDIPEMDIDDPDPSSAVERYRAIAGEMPKREDYQQGFGNKLLAGLAGAFAGYRDPSAGIKLTQGLLDRPYAEARQDWNDRLEGAKSEAELDVLSQKPQLERAKILEGARAKTLELQARMEAIKQKENDSLRDFEAAKLAASNAEERNRIIAEHNKAMESISAEKTSIAREALSIQSRLAGAREVSAGAYAFGQALKPMEITTRYRGTPPSANQRVLAHQEAIKRAVAENPDWSNFVSDTNGNLQIGPDEDWIDEPLPPELQRRVQEIESEILGGR